MLKKTSDEFKMIVGATMTTEYFIGIKSCHTSHSVTELIQIHKLFKLFYDSTLFTSTYLCHVFAQRAEYAETPLRKK